MNTTTVLIFYINTIVLTLWMSVYELTYKTKKKHWISVCRSNPGCTKAKSFIWIMNSSHPIWTFTEFQFLLIKVLENPSWQEINLRKHLKLISETSLFVFSPSFTGFYLEVLEIILKILNEFRKSALDFYKQKYPIGLIVDNYSRLSREDVFLPNK